MTVKDWDGHPFSVTPFLLAHVRCIKNSNMTSRLYFTKLQILTTPLSCNFQKRLEHKENQTKYRNMTRKSGRILVRILIQLLNVGSWDSFCEKWRVPVQNHSPSLKRMSKKLKMLGLLCNQTVNLKTDSKTLYYSILKLKYSPSILKHNKG